MKIYFYCPLLVALIWLSGSMTGCVTLEDDHFLDYVPVDDSATRAISASPYGTDQHPSTMGEQVSIHSGIAMDKPNKRFTRTPMPVQSALQKTPTQEIESTATIETSAAVEPLQPLTEEQVEHLPAARVTHVNLKDKYVILQCEKSPKRGEDAQIFRGTEQVGVVRFVSSRRGRYIVADIIEGEPQRGDIARYKCIFPKEKKPKRERSKKKSTDPKQDNGFKLFF